MNEEKTKKLLLFLFLSIIIGGSIWAIFSLTYSPIKDLRSNTISEANSYKNTDKINNNDSGNKLTENNITSDESTIENKSSSITSTTPIETELATYTTTIYDTDESRIHNIKLAVEKLNNATIEINQEFSFNNTIGPMGEKQGYKKATGFDGNGKKIQIYGGGMCQISSTLYNAVLIANLEVTERHAHSRRVYYVPQDKDASVAYGGADFKFKNTSDKKLKIIATTDGHDVTITLYKID